MLLIERLRHIVEIFLGPQRGGGRWPVETAGGDVHARWRMSRAFRQEPSRMGVPPGLHWHRFLGSAETKHLVRPSPVRRSQSTGALYFLSIRRSNTCSNFVPDTRGFPSTLDAESEALSP